MGDFEVDLEALSSFVESLSSFEEAATNYDVEDWVPNSGMLENPDVWDKTGPVRKLLTVCLCGRCPGRLV